MDFITLSVGKMGKAFSKVIDILFTSPFNFFSEIDSVKIIISYMALCEFFNKIFLNTKSIEHEQR